MTLLVVNRTRLVCCLLAQQYPLACQPRTAGRRSRQERVSMTETLLAEAVQARRKELGMTPPDVAAAGGPSVETQRKFAMRVGNPPRERTLLGFDRALRWKPGTCQSILDGKAGTDPTTWISDVIYDPGQVVPYRNVTVRGNAADKGRQLLADAVRTRRAQLNLAQEDLAKHGGPGDLTIRKIERGDVVSYQAKTIYQLESALQWEDGTVRALLNGIEVGTFVEEQRSIEQVPAEDAVSQYVSVTDLLFTDPERLLTNRDLAAIMRVPEKTVRVWASKGTGPRRIRVGRFVRYRAADITAWLNERYVDGPSS